MEVIMHEKTTTLFKVVWLRIKHSLQMIRHWAHSLEHPVHLGYFGMMVFHFDYKVAAMGCLIVGLAAMLPNFSE
jgi:hypothetical protein